MNSDKELELTGGQRLAGNIIAGAFVVACGIFLLLVGLNVIPLKLTDIIVAALLTTVGLVLLVTALIHNNTVSLWISFAFLVPALVEYLAKYTALGYRNLYPFYIAIPAIASLFTMLLSHEWRDHLRVIIFFGLISGTFFLQSCSVLGWAVVLPMLVIFVGLLIVYIALMSKKSKDEDNE